MTPTALFVDDEPAVTAALRRVLHSAPFQILTANSAEEGFAVLRQQPVSVVVSDERMPGLTGAAFLTAVRAEFPDVGRIILTGEASVEATIAAVNDANVFRVLTKPCPPDELVACISEAIETAAGPDGAAVQAALGERFERALDCTSMAYQPIYCPGEARIWAYESLLRTSDPDIAGVGELIDLATTLGRQVDLDRHVCRLVAEDLNSLPDGVRLFVNLLPESLDEPELLAGSDGLLPFADRIGLEITERAPLNPVGPAIEKLTALRSAGFHLVLDDLGAGYAGLTSFATLQPDVVKFDMELVRDIDHSPTCSRVVSSMVELCRDLGILTVAEGIETQAEFAHLVDLGCDLFQGYAIARPGPPWVGVSASLPDSVAVPAAPTAVVGR